MKPRLTPAGCHESRHCRWSGTAAFVVFEENVRFFPRLARHDLRPLDERRFVVIETMQPEVSPRRGADDRALEVFLFRHAHRDVPLAESVVDIVVEPALVPELEHVLAVRGKQSKKSAEAGHILFQIGWELKKNRPQSVAEH